MSEVEVVIDMPAEYSSMVFGQFDEYAKAIESNLNIELIARYVFPVPAGPIPNTIILSLIWST